MPKAPKKGKKILKSIVELPTEFPTKQPECTDKSCCCEHRFPKTAKVAIVLGIIILGLLAINRGLIVAAMVNGKPIFRWNINKILVARYGTTTLENMIAERLIADEAAKKGIAIGQKDIEAKEAEILQSFGGISLDEALKLQGITKNDFDDQIKLQMMLTALLGKDIVISEEEIATYVQDNAAMLSATDAAGMNSEAKEAILTQKIGEKLQPWFTDLKNNAKIYRLMK